MNQQIINDEEYNMKLSLALGIEVMSQWEIHFGEYDEQKFVTPYSEKDKAQAEELLFNAKNDDKLWSMLIGRYPLIEHDSRQKGVLFLRKWPMRLKETPGGAWNVIEKLKELGWAVTLETMVDGSWSVELGKEPHYIAKINGDMPTAVCAAALAALEGSGE